MDLNSATTTTNMSGSEHPTLEGLGSEITKLLIDEMHISAGPAFASLPSLLRTKNAKAIPDSFSDSEDKWTEFKKIIDPLHKERVVKQDGSTISRDPDYWVTFTTLCASLWLVGESEEEVNYHQIKMDHLYRLQATIESGEGDESDKQHFERVARDVLPAFLTFIKTHSGQNFSDMLQTDVTKESAEDEDEDKKDGTSTHLDKPPSPAPAPEPQSKPQPEEKKEEEKEEGQEEEKEEGPELELEPEPTEDVGNTGGDSVEKRLPNFTQHMINLLRGANLLVEDIEDGVAKNAISKCLDGIIDLVRIETTEMNKVELVEELTQEITEQVRVEVEKEFEASQLEEIRARLARDEEYEREKAQLAQDAALLRASVETLEKQVETMEERNKMWERNFEKAAKAYFDPDAEGSSSAMVSAPSSPPNSANGSPSDTRPDASLAAAAAAAAEPDELSLPPAAEAEPAATESAAPAAPAASVSAVRPELQPKRTMSWDSARTNQSGRSTLTAKDLELEGEAAQYLWDRQLRLPKGEYGTDEPYAPSSPPPSYRRSARDTDLGAEEESPIGGMQRAVGVMHSGIELMMSSVDKAVGQKNQANLEKVAAHTENKQLRQKVQDLEERLQAQEQELKDMSAQPSAPAPAPCQITEELRAFIDEAASAAATKAATAAATKAASAAAAKACLLSSQKMAELHAEAAQRAANVEFQVSELWQEVEAEVAEKQMLETEEDGQEATQGVLPSAND